MLKKLLLIFLIVIFSPILSASANTIGYVDYNEVLDHYNFAKITFKEIDMKAANMQEFLAQKGEEYSQLETPVQKTKFEQEMKTEIEKRETAFNTFRERREQAIKDRIQSAIDKVRDENGLDVILSNENVLSGGMDITKLVIEYLNK